MEEMELPAGWAKASLEQLISNDGLFSDGDWVESKDQDPEGQIRLLQLADVGDSIFLDKSARFVNDEQYERLRCTEVLQGDILIARMPDPLGRACLVPSLGQRLITVVDVAIVRPGRDSVFPRWLMYAINSPLIRGSIELQSTGTTRRRITRKKLAALDFPVPPLNEQRRIAAKLDTTLAAVDACRQRLDGVAELLRRFRQAVLAAATSGELTQEWREEQQLKEWQAAVLGDLIQDGPKNGLYKPQSDYGGGVSILRIDNFYDGCVRDWSRLKLVRVSPAEAAEYSLQPGDLVVNRVNSLPYLGKTALIEDPPGQCVFESNMMRIRFDRSKVLPAYVNLFLCSPLGVSRLRKRAKHAVNQASINQQDVKAVSVPLPSIPEQQQIVRRAQELFTLADQLEARLHSARRVVDRLTPALLAKAFRGELVPQDPSDEPASALLERIRAARQAEAGARKPSRRGRKPAAAHPDQTSPGLDSKLAAVASDPVPPDQLATLLQECGPLSEKALLAASELEPGRFLRQLQLELQAGTIREQLEEGGECVGGGLIAEALNGSAQCPDQSA